MNVLIACEESQAVCKAFRERCHNAFSCDIQECSGGRPEWHIQGDCLPLINGNCEFTTSDGVQHTITGKWDLLIAHPPCTFLTVSGNRWFNIERYGDKALKRLKEREAAAEFFMRFVNADCKHIAIENPVGYMSSYYRKPDQIIQPWQFGHGEVKATCLWLKNLPKLQPSEIVNEREAKVWKMPPGPERAKLRSKTYPGIAAAMAEQWGSL